MNRYFPWIVLLAAVLWLGINGLQRTPRSGEWELTGFGRLPVLSEGRIKPLDTVARNSLLIIHGKETILLEGNRRLDAIHWLTETLFRGAKADTYPVFVIHHPEVLGLARLPQEGRKDFSFTELSPSLEKINAQAELIEKIDSSKRTPYQVALFNLRNSLLLYQRLKNSLYPDDVENFSDNIDSYLKALPAGMDALKKSAKGEPFDQSSFDALSPFLNRYQLMADMAYFLPIPNEGSVAKPHNEFVSMGSSLLQAVSSDTINPATSFYSRIGEAYHSGNTNVFDQQLNALSQWMSAREHLATRNALYETLFNRFDPFYKAMELYVVAFLFLCAFWLWGKSPLHRTACLLLLLALVVHTFGLLARMALQGRPPVTNLYSSAIFVGWATVVISLFIEKIYRDGIGAACAAIVGFTTLIIARHLTASGDTLGMLQAVLDSNIWLATHVVAITIGYSAMFLAGTLASIYTLRTLLSSFKRESAHALALMIYGVICFATLFSFVGTVLGGIWADQSWGRFWGWDPKENGALLIVLWCAIILHARWGGFIRDRGLVAMALIGNVITSFSWFGVNMLGIGLHSYGFTEKALPWLARYMLLQLLLVAVLFLRSPRTSEG